MSTEGLLAVHTTVVALVVRNLQVLLGFLLRCLLDCLGRLRIRKRLALKQCLVRHPCAIEVSETFCVMMSVLLPMGAVLVRTATKKPPVFWWWGSTRLKRPINTNAGDNTC